MKEDPEIAIWVYKNSEIKKFRKFVNKLASNSPVTEHSKIAKTHCRAPQWNSVGPFGTEAGVLEIFECNVRFLYFQNSRFFATSWSPSASPASFINTSLHFRLNFRIPELQTLTFVESKSVLAPISWDPPAFWTPLSFWTKWGLQITSSSRQRIWVCNTKAFPFRLLEGPFLRLKITQNRKITRATRSLLLQTKNYLWEVHGLKCGFWGSLFGCASTQTCRLPASSKTLILR